MYFMAVSYTHLDVYKRQVVDDIRLPDVVIDIVEEYDDKITYLMLNKNTDGDRTEITNVDGSYELIGNNGVKNYVDNGHYNLSLIHISCYNTNTINFTKIYLQIFVIIFFCLPYLIS